MRFCTFLHYKEDNQKLYLLIKYDMYHTYMNYMYVGISLQFITYKIESVMISLLKIKLQLPINFPHCRR